jgi:hypothetical protein
VARISRGLGNPRCARPRPPSDIERDRPWGTSAFIVWSRQLIIRADRRDYCAMSFAGGETAPVFTDIPARRSLRTRRPTCFATLSTQPPLVADLRCGPPTATSRLEARGHGPIRAPSRGFVAWRSSDAGRRACRNVRHDRRLDLHTTGSSSAASLDRRLGASAKPPAHCWRC